MCYIRLVRVRVRRDLVHVVERGEARQRELENDLAEAIAGVFVEQHLIEWRLRGPNHGCPCFALHAGACHRLRHLELGRGRQLGKHLGQQGGALPGQLRPQRHQTALRGLGEHVGVEGDTLAARNNHACRVLASMICRCEALTVALRTQAP